MGGGAGGDKYLDGLNSVTAISYASKAAQLLS